MLDCVKYINNRSRKQSSIFPKLIGSRRRVKTEVPTNNNNVYITPPRKQAYFTKQEQQLQFLNRMKKARDIILSHHKNSKADLQKKQYTSMIEELNLQEHRRGKLKCFSQVVYNIRSSNKRSLKENNIGSDFYNDRLLRECRSQFKSNQNQRQKNQRKHILFTSNKRKEKSERLRNMGEKLLFQDKINSPHNFIHSKKSAKVDSAERLLMNIDLSQQIINSNGSQLIQKLINVQKQKRNQSKSEEKINIEKQEETIHKIQQQDEQKCKQIIKFPFDSHKVTSSKKIKLKLVQNNRRKSFMPFKKQKEYVAGINKSTQIYQQYNQNQNSDQEEQTTNHNRSTLQKKQIKEDRQKNKNNQLSLSRYINSPNFKIDRWDPSGTIDFQAF